MARGKRPSLWVVVRFAPFASRWSDRAEFYTRTGEDDEETPQGTPVASFVERADAEAEAARLHALAIRETPIGPFLRELLPEGRDQILKAARAAGVPEPDFASVGPVVEPHTHSLGYQVYGADLMAYREKLERAVREWWDRIADTISPDALAKLWEVLFPDFSFYRVGRVLLEE